MFEFAPISDRIKAIRAKRDAFTGGKYMTINSERTRLYTEYYKAHENEYPLMKRAGALLYWAQNRAYNIFDDDIFAGGPGPDQRTMSPYVEWGVGWIPGVVDDEENFKEAWQSGDSVYMSDADRDIFKEAYEYWKDKTINKMAEGIMTDEIWEATGNGMFAASCPGRPGYRGICSRPQGHYVGNFRKAINTGFAAVKEEAQQKINEMNGKIFDDQAYTFLFYHAVVRVCDAAMTMSKGYAKAAREKAETVQDEARKKELLMMADGLDWIMEHPARTYWEGLQAAILYQIMLSTDAQQHGQSMGRIDNYVGHLLHKELEEGKLSIEQAQEYTDALILRLSDIIVLPGMPVTNKGIIDMRKAGKNIYSMIYNGLTPTSGLALTLGGRNADGSDASNEATALFLQTYGRMHFPDPTCALRIHPGTPDEIWRLGIESCKLSGGIPQMQNDEVIIPQMMSHGFSLEDAADYSIVGCVEPGGTGNEWTAAGTTGSESMWNTVNVLLCMINGGINPTTGKMALPCKKLYECETFDEFKANYEAELQYLLNWSVSFSNMFELMYGHYFPCIAASALMEGCMESGKDVNHGGAKYNRTGITSVGTANIADGMMAIKKLCFDDKTVSTREMFDALQANWEGYEDLRQTIINEVPHYGNDNDEVDELASWVLGLFAKGCTNATGPRGHYSGGTFTMTAHMYYGAMTLATPDGRKSGEPLADAISSRQGFDKNGPTAYLRSAAKLPHKELTNGDQLNIRFSPGSVAGDEGAAKLKALINTYFKLGGMQVQFNVVGTEDLHKAQEKPEDYQDLIVRIAGFSTYFVSLDKKTQDDFITRTEQSI